MWSDSFLPVRSNPDRTPNSSSQIRNNLEVPEENLLSAAATAMNQSISSCGIDEINDKGLAQETQDESQRLEDMAIEYLEKYVFSYQLRFTTKRRCFRFARCYDTDRALLGDAYADNATFSYSIHDLIEPNSLAAAFMDKKRLERLAPRKFARNIREFGGVKHCVYEC